MRSILFALVLSAALPASPARAAGCLPEVRLPWVRMAPAAMPMGAAFFVIENRCRTPAVIAYVEAPDFDMAGVHETRMEGGMSRMRAVQGLRIEAGRRVEFRPGGLHLMLMGAQRNLGPGKQVLVRLRLADGRVVAADFPVRDAAP